MIVSFETAVKLLNAGFPQPELGSAQFWYVRSDPEDEYEIAVMIRARGLQERILTRYTDRFFAPTATDILLELGLQFNLTVDRCNSVDGWSCVDESEDGRYFFRQNPAEACALAWLEADKKCMAITIPPTTIIKCAGAIEIPENE